MLNLNNRLFAKNEKEFTESLFNRNGSALGYYRKLKHGIKLLDHNKEPLAFIVDRPGETFIVSCSKFQNKTRYSFALTTIDERKLGFDKLGYLEQHDVTKAAIESITL